MSTTTANTTVGAPAPAGLSRLLLVVAFSLTTIAIVAGFFWKTWMPPVASEHGEGVDFVIHYLFVTTGVIFVIGHGFLIWMVWRFSSGAKKSGFAPESNRAQWLAALIPVVFMAAVSEAGVLVLGHSVFVQLYGDPPADVVDVEVTGRQFEWLVRYPGADGKLGRIVPAQIGKMDPNLQKNELGLDETDPAAADDVLAAVLYVPVDTTVIVRLRTQDVQHSFSVPAFRVKQDLVPGLVTRARFKATKVGEFEIACAELCGGQHYRMKGRLIVLSQKDYKEWLAKQIGWLQ